MINTFRSDSGLSFLTDNIFQIINGRVRALHADETNDKVVIFLEEKDNSLTTNSGTSERISLVVEDGKAASVAESIINALNGLPTSSQLLDKFAVKAVLADNVTAIDFSYTFDSDNGSLDLEIDPDAADVSAETFTLIFEGLSASSGPYDYSVYIENVDSSGDPVVTLTGPTLTGTVSADANGKITLNPYGYYLDGETATAIPITDTDIVNTAHVVLTNPNQSYSVSLDQVIAVTHEA